MQPRRDNDSPGPLIVYLPNAPYTNYSNVTTFQPEYTTEQWQAIILNGYKVATMANPTVDAQWPACLGCCDTRPQLVDDGDAVPGVCGECFQRYCWNGTVSDATPATYEPTKVLKPRRTDKKHLLRTCLRLRVQGRRCAP